MSHYPPPSHPPAPPPGPPAQPRRAVSRSPTPQGFQHLPAPSPVPSAGAPTGSAGSRKRKTPPLADHPPPPQPPQPQPASMASPSPAPDGQGSSGAQGRQLSTSKRAEQNRKAQRAFRERRDQHVKSLESRAQLVDAALASAEEANRRWEECRNLVDQLRAENAALRAALADLQAQVAALKAQAAEYAQPSSTSINNGLAPLPPLPSNIPGLDSASKRKHDQLSGNSALSAKDDAS